MKKKDITPGFYWIKEENKISIVEAQYQGPRFSLLIKRIGSWGDYFIGGTASKNGWIPEECFIRRVRY